MRGLNERPIVVTGAASGIGRATCERLIAEGATVALVDRNRELLEELAQTLGPRALPLVADVSQENDVRAAIDGAANALGGLRGLVTSAGIFDPNDYRPFADVDFDTFSRTLGVNLAGTFLAVKYALSHLLRDGGAIVTIASTAGLRGHGFGAGYTASKGGVVALTRLLAFQYGAQQVRANCICPGATDTPMAGGAFDDPELSRLVTRAIPLRRVAQPEEIGNAACYLLSDDASYVNGQVIAVDGGATVI
jgi:NAD(P)-dependent dehydrogenase (short-subunit alcohol dehydrogenase family)